jgi:hypothetical protein
LVDLLISKEVPHGILIETDFLVDLGFLLRPTGHYLDPVPVYDATDVQTLVYYVLPPESTEVTLPGSAQFVVQDFPPELTCQYCLRTQAYDTNPDNRFREAIGTYGGVRVCREHAIYLQLASDQPLPINDPFRLHSRPVK